MIEIQATKTKQFLNSKQKNNKQKSLDSYYMSFYRNTFLFTQKFEYDHLIHFSQKNQKKLGKTLIKFDLSHIKQIINNSNNNNNNNKLNNNIFPSQSLQSQSKLKDINFLVISNYQDLIIAPYIIRRYKNLKILITNLAYQLGSIYMQEFYKTIKQLDSQYQSLQSTYFDQSIINQRYQQYFNDIQNKNQNGIQGLIQMVSIFTLIQLKQTLKKCIKVNYGQIYNTQKGINIIAFPSGYNLGSAIWYFQSIMTKQSLLWIQYAGKSKWRSCLSLWNKTQQNNHIKIDHLIISQKLSKSIQNTIQIFQYKNKQQQKNKQTLLLPLDQKDALIFLQSLEKSLNHNKNIIIILKDQLDLIDLIYQIDFKLKSKFNQIFVQNDSIQKMVMYSNSYVQYLSQNYKKKIYNDPPEYPFQILYGLKEKGFFSSGKLQKIALKQKIPLKELLLRSTPYLRFILDYRYNLKTLQNQKQDQIVINNIFQPFLSINNLQEFIKKIQPKHIFVFSHKILNCFDQSMIQLNMKQSFCIGKPQTIILNSKNISDGILSKYELKNGIISGVSFQKQFIKLGKNWKQQLYKQLSLRKIQCQIDPSCQKIVLKKDIENSINNSYQFVQVYIQDFQIKIRGNTDVYLLVLQELFNLTSIGPKVKFR